MKTFSSVLLWICDVQPLSDPSLFARGLFLLPWEERREQVMHYRFEKDRRLCLGAGLLLASALREAGAEDLRLRVLPNGKPELAHVPDLHFNLSHSGTLAVCAVAADPVGADVETLQKADPAVGAVCFRSAEQEWIRNAGDPDRAFTRLWTRKESLLKLRGEGLALDPASFSVLPEEDGARDTRFFETEIAGHLICVCTQKNNEVILKHRQIDQLC